MAIQSKTTKIRIAGPAMTNRRYSQYSAFKIDGAVPDTQTDNTAPTIAQMDALVKALYRYRKLSAFMADAGVRIDSVITDTSNMTSIPTTVELTITYNPDVLVPADTVVAGVTATLAAAAIATQKELNAIANVVAGALQRVMNGVVENYQTWNDQVIEVVRQPNAIDNTVSKKYNAIQLTTKEIVLDGFAAAITVTEF